MKSKQKNNLPVSARNCLTLGLLSSLLLMMNPASAQQLKTEGFWGFKQSSGAIRDTARGRLHDGWVGTYETRFNLTADPLRRAGRDPSDPNQVGVVFKGQTQEQVVMIPTNPDTGTDDFQPGMSSFSWEVRLKLGREALDLEKDGRMIDGKQSWNVMQKGRSNQLGMWKMSVLPFTSSNRSSHFTDTQNASVKRPSESTLGEESQAEHLDPVASCVVQDNNPDRDHNTYSALSQVKLRVGQWYRIKCEIDRTSNELTVTVRDSMGRKINPPAGSNVADISRMGPVNPGMDKIFDCKAGEPTSRFGGHNLLTLVAIGNKPHCPNFARSQKDKLEDGDASNDALAQAKLDEILTDAFKGRINWAKISK